MQKTEIPFKLRLFYFFPVLFCFFFPFGYIFLSIITIPWLVTSLFNFDKEQFINTIKTYRFLLPVCFLIYTCISAMVSQNRAEALTAIEIKLSFVIFPYLLFCFKWPIHLLKRCIVSFVSGCFFACAVLLFRSAVYAYQGETDYFFYTRFSAFMHPSYFAMYQILALSFIILFYHKWFKSQKTIVYSYYFFIFIIITSVFLCSSKTGLICLFVCLPALLAYKYQVRLTFKNALFSLIVLLVLLFSASKIFPDSFERLNSLTALNSENIDKTSSESTKVRLLIWEQSRSIIRNHFLFGTGVGDANDELYKAYASNGLTGAFEHKLNAHSQYLQTFIGMGIIGFLLLLFLVTNGFIRSIKSKNMLHLVFIFIIAFNFFVESMLQTAAGVLFFAFFYCFLKLFDTKQLSE